MDIHGEYRIEAAPEQVWRDLNDPEVLRACIPGCEALSQVGEDDYECEVIAKFGPVKAKFKSTLAVRDRKPPHSYAIIGAGKGGVAGFGKGRADVQLTEDGATTVLTYTASLSVGGKLAQIGSRLLGATTRKLSDEFFSAFTARYPHNNS